MRFRQFGAARSLAAGMALGTGLGLTFAQGIAHAEFLELYTTNPTSFTQAAGGSATVTYQGRLTGMGNNVVSSYDIGLIYNPLFLTLQSFAFDASNLLGDPTVVNYDVILDLEVPEVLQTDPWDNVNNPPGDGTVEADKPVNRTWNYTDNSSVNNPAPTGLTYDPVGGADPDLGSPVITGSTEINKGSVRFSAVSYLDLTALQTLQGTPSNDPRPLFEVTFLVELDVAGRTPVNIVYSTDYPDATSSELDFKYGPGSTQPQYPIRVNGEIVVAAAVPIPGPLFLMLPGLAFVALRRRA